MKSKEELNTLKEEVETVNKKLMELTEEELTQVTGGAYINDKYKQDTDTICYPTGQFIYDYYQSEGSH